MIWIVSTNAGEAVIIAAHVAAIIPSNDSSKCTVLLVSGRALEINHTVQEVKTWPLI